MKKIRIGIELNHVIRNINKQIVKYYQQYLALNPNAADRADIMKRIEKMRPKSN